MNILILTFFIVITLFLLPFLLIIKQRNKLPPGPTRLPIIGNLHQLTNFNYKLLQSLSQIHGPLMFLQLGSFPSIVISSAEIAKQIFKTHDLNFSNRPVLYTGKKFTYNCSNLSFCPYGDYWKEVKKILTREIFNANKVQSLMDVREEEIKSMVSSIGFSSKPLNFSELSHSLSSNVVCRVVFGKKLEHNVGFLNVLREIQEMVVQACVSDFFAGMEWINKVNGLESKIEKSFEGLDKFYDEILEEHVNGDDSERVHGDLVDALIRIQKDPTQAISLTNTNVKAIISDLFFAGTDTSSATLVWTMTELIRNPSAMRTAQEEIRRVANGKEMVGENDVPRLTYLKSVLKEVLRIHPPAPLLLPRETMKACRIGEYEIPAKTRVFINAKAIAMDSKYWESPNEFKPERFLGSSVDFRGQHFEFIPFGVGRRICPGMNFAVMLIELALANLLYKFDWGLPDGITREDLDMEEATGITMHKKVALFLVAKPVTV